MKHLVPPGDEAENSIMQTISIAVSAILIAAGLITAPSLINNARDVNAKQDLANISLAQEYAVANDGRYYSNLMKGEDDSLFEAVRNSGYTAAGPDGGIGGSVAYTTSSGVYSHAVTCTVGGEDAGPDDSQAQATSALTGGSVSLASNVHTTALTTGDQVYLAKSLVQANGHQFYRSSESTYTADSLSLDNLARLFPDGGAPSCITAQIPDLESSGGGTTNPGGDDTDDPGTVEGGVYVNKYNDYSTDPAGRALYMAYTDTVSTSAIPQIIAAMPSLNYIPFDSANQWLDITNVQAFIKGKPVTTKGDHWQFLENANVSGDNADIDLAIRNAAKVDSSGNVTEGDAVIGDNSDATIEAFKKSGTIQFDVVNPDGDPFPGGVNTLRIKMNDDGGFDGGVKTPTSDGKVYVTSHGLYGSGGGGGGATATSYEGSSSAPTVQAAYSVQTAATAEDGLQLWMQHMGQYDEKNDRAALPVISHLDYSEMSGKNSTWFDVKNVQAYIDGEKVHTSQTGWQFLPQIGSDGTAYYTLDNYPGQAVIGDNSDSTLAAFWRTGYITFEAVTTNGHTVPEGETNTLYMKNTPEGGGYGGPPNNDPGYGTPNTGGGDGPGDDGGTGPGDDTPTEIARSTDDRWDDLTTDQKAFGASGTDIATDQDGSDLLLITTYPMGRGTTYGDNYENDSYLIVSTNFGETWHNAADVKTEDGTVVEPKKVWIDTAGRYWATNGAYVWKSINKGSSWITVHGVMDDDSNGFNVDADVSQDGQRIVVWNGSANYSDKPVGMDVSIDGGSSWSHHLHMLPTYTQKYDGDPQVYTYSWGLFNIRWVGNQLWGSLLNPSDNKNSHSGIWYSQDFGNSFVKLSTSPVDTVNNVYSSADGQTALITSYDTPAYAEKWITHDQGHSWKQVTALSGFNLAQYGTSISNDGQTIVANDYGYSTSVSYDGGDTWAGQGDLDSQSGGYGWGSAISGNGQYLYSLEGRYYANALSVGYGLIYRHEVGQTWTTTYYSDGSYVKCDSANQCTTYGGSGGGGNTAN